MQTPEIALNNAEQKLSFYKLITIAEFGLFCYANVTKIDIETFVEH